MKFITHQIRQSNQFAVIILTFMLQKSQSEPQLKPLMEFIMMWDLPTRAVDMCIRQGDTLMESQDIEGQ